MKKSIYIELAISRSKYGDAKGRPGINGMDKPAGSKLSRKANNMEPSRYRGGVVSKAYENIAKAQRA